MGGDAPGSSRHSGRMKTRPVDPAPAVAAEHRVDARLLRLADVLKRVPVGRSTWFAGIASGRFPKPVKLGPKTSAWRSGDIDRIVAEGVE